MVTIKRPVKKPKAQESDPNEELVNLVIEMIGSKELDPFLSVMDNAISSRIAEHEAETSKNTKKTVATKTQTKSESISKPPARESASAKPPLVPEVGKTYLIDSRVKKIGGAKVEFLRTYSKDEKKSVVKMTTEKPGFPKGKILPVPTTALQPVAKTRRVANSK